MKLFYRKKGIFALVLSLVMIVSSIIPMTVRAQDSDTDKLLNVDIKINYIAEDTDFGGYKIESSGNGNPRLSDVVVFGQISLFVLKAPEPSLNHDVVRPAALAVHTLADSVFADELAIAVACKLTALIRVILNSV